MKKLFISFTLLQIFLQCWAQTPIPYLKQNGKFIYVDSLSLKQVKEYEFEDALPFSGNFAFAKWNGKYGFINKKGEPVIDPLYTEVFAFKNGLARVSALGLFTFIDTSGKAISPLQFQSLDEFTEGIAKAKKNGKWGYIDRTGKEVIPLVYDWISDFSDGLCVIKKGDKYGFINKKGVVVIPASYDFAESFKMGLAPVQKKDQWGFVDKTGKEIIQPRYFHTMNSGNGALYISVDSGRGVYRRGVMDKTGKIIIPPRYSGLIEFTKGIYLVKQGDKVQIINTASKVLAEWSDFVSWKMPWDGVTFLEIKKGLPDEGKWVMMNSQGKEITNTRFRAIGKIENGIVAVKSDSGWGFIDKSGKLLSGKWYDDIYSFSEKGFAKVKQNGKWFYINKTGTEYREKLNGDPGWLFFEEFKDNSNHWLIDLTSKDFESKIEPNLYRMTNNYVNNESHLTREIPGMNEKNNFRIETTIWLGYNQQKEREAGLIFGYDEKGEDHFRFVIADLFRFRIEKYVNGKAESITGTKYWDDIQEYSYVKLGFVHLNGKWIFYINDSKVYEMNAMKFFGNRTGYYVCPGLSISSTIFKVYDWTLARSISTASNEPLFENVLLDEFNNNNNKWELYNLDYLKANIERGSYNITYNTGVFKSTLPFYASDIKSCRVQASIDNMKTGNDNPYGLCLGYTRDLSYISFCISQFGHFSIIRYEKDKPVKIISDWKETNAIRKGEDVRNTLQFINHNNIWSFYINYNLVYTCPAESFPGNNFGIMAGGSTLVKVVRFSFAKMLFSK